MPAGLGGFGRIASPIKALRNAFSQPLLRPMVEVRVAAEDSAALLLSSSTSCGVDRMRRMSEQLWIVVEQLIWPPRKKATVPSALKRGAGGRRVSGGIGEEFGGEV